MNGSSEPPDLVLLLRAALNEAVGAAIVLDSRLRVVAATEHAERLLGDAIPLGVMAPKLLCGNGPERPVAEAMAAGRPVAAQLLRSDPDGGDRLLQVRATPLGHEGERLGWLLLLDDRDWQGGAGKELVTRWGIITRDPVMKELLHDIGLAAVSDAAVLVRGETGSGKELVARAIHTASRRVSGPFRAINCAALPPSLLESALFGHTRGAFTGATRDEPGHFRLAQGGTLFLDEVGDLPLELQAKLLRVLQDKSVIPIGGREPIEVDVRIVTATHKSLRDEVQQGRFRADLMFRIRVIPLFLPPLRDRREDVEPLAWHFVERRHQQAGRVVSRISDDALAALRSYDWPGNVRELDNAIEYAFVMGRGAVLDVTQLPPEVRGEGAQRRMNVPAPLPADLSPEARRIMRALERAGGHRGRAAASLGVSRTTLWRRMQHFGLDGGEPDDS